LKEKLHTSTAARLETKGTVKPALESIAKPLSAGFQRRVFEMLEFRRAPSSLHPPVERELRFKNNYASTASLKTTELQSTTARRKERL